MLAGDRKWLPIFLSVIEQVSLVAFERSFCDLGWNCDSISSAPRQEHLHVNATNPERGLSEALHRKMLEIPIEK
jgi:hypothetical protein